MILASRAGLAVIAAAALAAPAGARTCESAALSSAPGVHREFAAVECDGVSPCRNTADGLPLRVLARPFSTRFDRPRASGGTVVESNTQPFRPLFVFARQDIDFSNPAAPSGWYQIGATATAPEGWMRLADVIEWRQSLLAAYTHPGQGEDARGPVLGFAKLEDLEALVAAPDRREQAIDLGSASPERARAAGMLAREPAGVFLDIDETLYLLPIVDWCADLADDDPSRYLKLAATAPGVRGVAFGTAGEAAMLGAPDVDVVFGIAGGLDRAAMIDALGEALADLSAAGAIEPALRMGVAPAGGGQGEVALSTPAAFAETLRSGSEDEPRDGVSLVDAARSAIAALQRGDADIRLAVIVGDAASASASALELENVRRSADSADVYVLAIDAGAGEGSMSLAPLARNPGLPSASIVAAPGADPDALALALREINALVAEVVSRDAPAAGMAQAAADLGAAARIDYFGDAAEAPRDVQFWAFDRDLATPSRAALDVRVLITRKQLDDLARALSELRRRLDIQTLTLGDFTQSVRLRLTQTLKGVDDPEAESATSNAEVLPAWIDSLPYNTDLQALNETRIEGLTPDEIARLIDTIDARLALYAQILASPDAWRRLDVRDAGLDEVYPLPLSALP